MVLATEGDSIHLDNGLDSTSNKPDMVLQQMAVGVTVRCQQRCMPANVGVRGFLEARKRLSFPSGKEDKGFPH